MATGSASQNDAAFQEGRDAVDIAVGKALQRARPPSSLPDPAAPPDEVLLRYIDGTLDKDAHSAFERRLLLDPAARAHAALLKLALLEAQTPPGQPGTQACFSFYYSEGKLRFLRGPSVPLSATDSSPPSSQEILLSPFTGAPAVQLRLRPSAQGVELELSPSAVQGTLRCGGVDVSATGDSRFAGLGPARYELRVCLGSDALPPLVLDIRA